MLSFSRIPSDWSTQSPVHTHARRTESLTRERVGMEFSKTTGQTALTRCKAWPHKHTHQKTVY